MLRTIFRYNRQRASSPDWKWPERWAPPAGAGHNSSTDGSEALRPQAETGSPGKPPHTPSEKECCQKSSGCPASAGACLFPRPHAVRHCRWENAPACMRRHARKYCVRPDSGAGYFSARPLTARPEPEACGFRRLSLESAFLGNAVVYGCSGNTAARAEPPRSCAPECRREAGSGIKEILFPAACRSISRVRCSFHFLKIISIKKTRPTQYYDSAECAGVQPMAATQSAKRVVKCTSKQAAVQACLPPPDILSRRRLAAGPVLPAAILLSGFSVERAFYILRYHKDFLMGRGHLFPSRVLPSNRADRHSLTASSCAGSLRPSRSGKRARYRIRSCSRSVLPLPDGMPRGRTLRERKR